MGCFIPDIHRIPSCDPTTREIRKDERGYVIGWQPLEFWGDPIVFTSLREMAKDIIKRHSSLLDLRQQQTYQFDMSHCGFYGIVIVQWKPEVKCSADKTAVFKIDEQQFMDDLTKELIPISKLLPFV